MRSIGLLLALVISFAQAQSMSLHDVFEAAWQRIPQAKVLEAKRDEVTANQLAANSLLPDSPTLGLATRSDRLTQQRGAAEHEIELSLPLWLWNQREARQIASQTENTALEAIIINARLSVAGELRERLWTAFTAENEVNLARARLESAEKLETDVMRRVRAGDLARSDLLLIQQETFIARAALSEATLKRDQALARYSILTGFKMLPQNPEEEIKTLPEGAVHPRIAAAQQVTQRAQAKLRLVNSSKIDHPEISVQYRWERDTFDSSQKRDVRFGIRFPLPTAARNRPLITAAQTEVVMAASEEQLATVTVESELQTAQQALEHIELLFKLAEERQASARENADLFKKAFGLGEKSLIDLLRVNTAAREAEAAHIQSRTHVAAARARLNQARGILP